MSFYRRFFSGLLAVAAAAVAVGQSDAAGSVSQVRYAHDRFGNQTGAVVVIQTANNTWNFTLTSRFLNLPVRQQLALLDRQFNLGPDRDAVSGVLDSMSQAKQQAALQQTLDNQQRLMNDLNRMQQQQMIDNLNRQAQPPFIPPPPPPIPQPFVPPPVPHFP